MSPASQRPPDNGRARASSLSGREILFEFTKVGGQVRVAAVDAATGAEAVAFGPATASQADLERLALNKLRYVMGERRASDRDAGPGRVV